MSKKEKIKKIDNGIGDLRFIAALAVILGIIVTIINVWDGIKVSVDTYVENKNNNIVEYTKNFIKTENDENINRDEVEFVETKTDANLYMASYIGEEVLYITITIVGTIGFWHLANFYNKKSMDNPYDEKVINHLKKTQKIMYSTFIIWLVGSIIIFIPFMFTEAYYTATHLTDIIIYLIANAFIQFIIFILEKGKLKENK